MIAPAVVQRTGEEYMNGGQSRPTYFHRNDDPRERVQLNHGVRAKRDLVARWPSSFSAADFPVAPTSFMPLHWGRKGRIFVGAQNLEATFVLEYFR